MLTLLFLAALLVAGLIAFTALGVEDTKYHTSLSSGDGRMDVPVRVSFWEDALPGKQALPWIESEDK